MTYQAVEKSCSLFFSQWNINCKIAYGVKNWYVDLVELDIQHGRLKGLLVIQLVSSVLKEYFASFCEDL